MKLTDARLQIFIIATVFTALAVFIQVLPISTSTHFEKFLSIGPSRFVYLTSIFFISYSILQLPGGIFLDRYGIKIILPIFIGLTTIGMVLYWFSSSTYMLFLSRLICGVGCSIGYIASIYIAAKFFSPHRLPILLGILEAAAQFGTLGAANPLIYLLDIYGWFAVGAFISLFSVLLFILSLIVIKKLSNYTQEIIIRVSFAETSQNIFLMFKNKTLLYIFLYSFSTWLVIMSFAGFWLSDYLQKMHNYSEDMSLHFVQIYWISFIVSSIAIGFFINNSKSGKIAILYLALLGFLAYIYMFIPILFNYLNVLIVIITGGISAAGVIIAFSLIPYFVKPEQCGCAIAINNTFVVFGGYVGQMLFAYIVKKFDINAYMNIVHDPRINHHYYSGLVIYVLFTLIGLISASMIAFSKDPVTS